MVRRIAEESSRISDPESFDSKAAEYIRLKATIASLESRQKTLREDIFETLDLEGEDDGSGNIELILRNPVDGVVRLQKQRRVSRKPDLEKIEALTKDRGVYDQVFEMQPVLNEDALMALYYQEAITEEELDEMFPVVVTWALQTPKK